MRLTMYLDTAATAVDGWQEGLHTTVQTQQRQQDTAHEEQ